MSETPAAPPPVGTFRIKGKGIRHASIIPLQMGTTPSGEPNIVMQPGPMEWYDVGAELSDLTEGDIVAFHDRLDPVDEAATATLERVLHVPTPLLPVQEAPAEPEAEAPPAPVEAAAPAPVEESAEDEATHETGRAHMRRRP